MPKYRKLEPRKAVLKNVIRDQAELLAESQRDLRTVTDERDQLRRRLGVLTRLRTGHDSEQLERVATELTNETNKTQELEKFLQLAADTAKRLVADAPTNSSTFMECAHLLLEVDSYYLRHECAGNNQG